MHASKLVEEDVRDVRVVDDHEVLEVGEGVGGHVEGSVGAPEGVAGAVEPDEELVVHGGLVPALAVADDAYGASLEGGFEFLVGLLVGVGAGELVPRADDADAALGGEVLENLLVGEPGDAPDDVVGVVAVDLLADGAFNAFAVEEDRELLLAALDRLAALAVRRVHAVVQVVRGLVHGQFAFAGGHVVSGRGEYL